MDERNEILLGILEPLEDLTSEDLNSLEDADLMLLKSSFEAEISIISSILNRRKHQQIHFKPESKKTN